MQVNDAEKWRNMKMMIFHAWLKHFLPNIIKQWESLVFFCQVLNRAKHNISAWNNPWNKVFALMQVDSVDNESFIEFCQSFHRVELQVIH